MRPQAQIHPLEPSNPLGGELNAAIARAVVGIHRHHVGRGPTKAQVFFRHNVVVTILGDVLTRAEQTLVANGEHDTVLELREQLHEAMRPELVAAVERLSGRAVIAFMSDAHLDPDMAVEVFVMDRAVAGGAAEAPEPGEGDAPAASAG
jgi:uncharacterized protein YbcI